METVIGLPFVANREDVAETANCRGLGISAIGDRHEVHDRDLGTRRLGTEGHQLFTIGVPGRQDDDARRIRLSAITRQEQSRCNRQDHRSKEAR